jgi:hypothetical protein
LRKRTTVTIEWVSQKLYLRHCTSVTQAVSRMNRKPGKKLNQLQPKQMALPEKQ